MYPVEYYFLRLSNIQADQHTKAGFYRQKSPGKIASETRKKLEAGKIAEFDSKRKNLEKDLTNKIYMFFCPFSAAFFLNIATATNSSIKIL